MQWCVLFAIVMSLAVRPEEPISRSGLAPLLSLTAELLCQGLVVSVAWALTARTVAALQSEHRPRRLILEQHERDRRRLLVFWLVMNAVAMTMFGWPATARHLADAHGECLYALLRIGPMLVSLIVCWAIGYTADRECYVGVATLSRKAFLASQARTHLALPVATVVIVLAWADLIERLSARFPAHALPQLWQALPAILMVIGFPFLLRYAWKTTPLAAGHLRDELTKEAKSLGIHFKDVLVWQTQQQTMNAAFSGVLPQCRYVLLSDRLIGEMPIEDVKRVFRHEVAHAKLWHGLKLLCLSVATLTTTLALGQRLAQASTAWGLVAIIIPLACTFLLIGRIARLFELEADVWACRKHASNSEAYLHALAQVLGSMKPHQGSWLHPPFVQRCALVRMERDAAVRWLRHRFRLWLGTWFLMVLACLVFCYF